MDQDETLHRGRPRRRRHVLRVRVRVTWGPSSPKRRIAPNFRPMSVVAKRLDRLRCHLVRGRHRPRRHCVRPRWGRSSPKRERGHSPNFQPIYLLRPNGWMDQDAIWYGGRPRPRRHCVRQGSGPLKNQHIWGPRFLPHFPL